MQPCCLVRQVKLELDILPSHSWKKLILHRYSPLWSHCTRFFPVIFLDFSCFYPWRGQYGEDSEPDRKAIPDVKWNKPENIASHLWHDEKKTLHFSIVLASLYHQRKPISRRLLFQGSNWLHITSGCNPALHCSSLSWVRCSCAKLKCNHCPIRALSCIFIFQEVLQHLF